MNPIGKVTVQASPEHGVYDVSWTLNDTRLLAGEAYVYRSLDSANWGDPVNLKQPVRGTSWYRDSGIRTTFNDDSLFYRIVIFFDGKYYESPIGGLYRTLTARQQGILRKILNLELKDMRNAENGYEAWLFKPLLHGTPCPDCTDSVGVAQQCVLCPTCYGMRIVGGFADPVRVWVRREKGKVSDQRDMPGGAGSDDQDDVPFRALAFPLFRQNDMMVIPADDSRWVIGPVNFTLFRGIVPMVSDFTATNLAQGDVRLTIPLPE